MLPDWQRVAVSARTHSAVAAQRQLSPADQRRPAAAPAGRLHDGRLPSYHTKISSANTQRWQLTTRRIGYGRRFERRAKVASGIIADCRRPPFYPSTPCHHLRV